MCRISSLAIVMSVTFLTCISCAPTTPDPKPSDYDRDYTRDEKLQQVKLATTRNAPPPAGEPVVQKQARVLVHIRGEKNASYDALSGPKNHLAGHAPMPSVPGGPTTRPVGGGFPADVAAGPAPATPIVDASDGEAKVLNEFPFLFLTNGWAYISGIAPAAQTEHVVAGSDSTKFIIEIDRAGSTSPSQYKHRVYAIVGAITVQAYDGGPVGPVLELQEGRFYEVRNTGGTWAVHGPTIFPTGPGTFVQAVLDAAAAAQVP